jgi:hypothetical protein
MTEVSGSSSIKIWHLSITRWEGLWCYEYGRTNLALSEEWNSVTDSSVGVEFMISHDYKQQAFFLPLSFVLSC